MARCRCRRFGQLARDDRRRAGGGRAAAQLRARGPAGVAPGAAGRRLGLQRRAAVGARPPGPGAVLAGPAGAGRVARDPAARQLRPAEPRDPARPGPVGAVAAAAGRRNRQAHGPAEYLDLLAPAGCEVDAWETTYLHVLQGPDPVTEWYRGTGLRPVLAALGPGQAEEFVADYGKRVLEAYPPTPYGTVLPFRRVFVVARRAGA